MRLIHAFFVILFFVPTLYGNENSKSSLIPKKYVSSVGHYAIDFPENWEIMEGIMGTDVVALAPETDQDDLFRENVNVLYGEIDPTIEEESYYTQNLESLKQLLTDFSLEESKDVVINTLKARRLIFLHRMGHIKAKVMQYLILKGNKAYVLTFTADPDDFKTHKKHFESIANSFEITP